MLAVALLATIVAPVSAAPTTYHVDCSAGNDSASGTSPTLAWRSIAKANAASLAPGDRLLFKRGCAWTGPLNARWAGTSSAPITIGAYGSGALPRIQNAKENFYVTGSYLVFEYLATRSNPPSYDSGCSNQPMGMTKGFYLQSGSHNTVRNSEVSGFNVGIWLGSASHHNKVLNNVVKDNNVKDPDPNSDGGAVGVGLLGDDNEVAYNVISGSQACSRQHGSDGSAVEIYGGRYNQVHHNTARENHGFVEVGNSRSADNTLAYNVVTSTVTKASFAVARGAGDSWGPTYRTKLYNNSVYLTGSESFAVQCIGGCNSTVMTFRNNIVWARDRVGYVDAAWGESHNVWWSPNGPKIWFTKSGTSKTADPRFVNADGGDLRLASGSPAIDAGTTESTSAGFRTDMDGRSVPAGGGVDIGAYERSSTAAPAPTPAPTPTPAPQPTPTPAAPAAPATTLTRDPFTRNTRDAWGSAAIGGAWSVAGSAADYDVNGVEATAFHGGSGQMRSAVLQSVRVRDLDAVFRVKTSAAAAGDGQYAYFVARQVNASTEYRAKLHIAPAGKAYAQVTKVINNVESQVSPYVSVGTIHSVNGYLWVRLRVTGGSPTTLSMKVWKDGAAQPASWQTTGADSTSALQTSGTLGFRTYLSSGATGPVTYAFDDLTVTAP
jgi:parallel beta-helix repeat protein